MKLTFQLGFALILLGIAFSRVVDYLDMRQFEARLDQYVANISVSNYFGLVEFVKSKELSPSLVAQLNDQLTRADVSIKSPLENIRSEVAQKKSKALHGIGFFLFLASLMGIVHYSTFLKSKGK